MSIAELVNNFKIDRLIKICRENTETGFFIFGNGNICTCDRDYAEIRGEIFFNNIEVLKYLEDFIDD